MSIAGIGAAGAEALQAAAQGSAGTSSGGFGESIAKALESLEGDLSLADKGAQDVAQGKGDVQEAVLGMVRAEMELRVALAVRDRFVEGYRDLERMAL